MEIFRAPIENAKPPFVSFLAAMDGKSAEILAEMDSASALYFDRVSQIRMDRWAKGRVILVGDAAACASLLAGEGTGLALAEAYVLAGELASARGDHIAAFAGYQKRLMPLLRRKQQSALKFASIFAPRSAIELTIRNLLMTLLRYPVFANFLIGRDLRDDFELPDYPP